MKDDPLFGRAREALQTSPQTPGTGVSLITGRVRSLDTVSGRVLISFSTFLRFRASLGDVNVNQRAIRGCASHETIRQ
jgi:hypothetical protein